MSTAKLTFEDSRNKPVFFSFRENQFSHLGICLAEGFKELGIPFYSNINYWQIAPDEPDKYLCCYNADVVPDDSSIVIATAGWVSHNISCLQDIIFHPNRQYIAVYLDDMDGPTIWNPELNNFDLRLRTHYNSQSQYPLNCRAWAFGLSNRILQETSELSTFKERTKSLLVNFRVTQTIVEFSRSLLKADMGFLKVDSAAIIIDRPLRKIISEEFLPLIQKVLILNNTGENFENSPLGAYHYLQWVQTGKRHYPNYYKRLKKSVGCACFGGYINSNVPTGQPIVEWWDSWRFWESLVAGCVTFHVDFDKYGIQLPVMPQNWRHYIGIDLDNIHDTVDRITDKPEILETISQEGRQWAIENYAPVPTALRFLEMLGCYIQQNEGGSAALSLSMNLRQINLIVFPDWSQPEESLGLELERVVRAIATHPDKNKMTLLVDSSNISDEDANLVLSSVAMNLLMEEDLDVSDGPEISLIGQLSEIQWSVLISRLYGRIVLDNENREAIGRAKAENIPSLELDRFMKESY
jgi:hypothetical protein